MEDAIGRYFAGPAGETIDDSCGSSPELVAENSNDRTFSEKPAVSIFESNAPKEAGVYSAGDMLVSSADETWAGGSWECLGDGKCEWSDDGR